MAPRLSAADFKSRSQAERLYGASDADADDQHLLELSRQTKAVRKKKSKRKFLDNKTRGARSILGGSASIKGRKPRDEEEMA
jgi:hypothetical protein